MKKELGTPLTLTDKLSRHLTSSFTELGSSVNFAWTFHLIPFSVPISWFGQLRCRRGSEGMTHVPCQLSLTPTGFFASFQWADKPSRHVLSYLNYQNTRNHVNNDIFRPVKKVHSSLRKSAVYVRGCWDRDSALLLATLCPTNLPSNLVLSEIGPQTAFGH